MLLEGIITVHPGLFILCKKKASIDAGPPAK